MVRAKTLQELKTIRRGQVLAVDDESGLERLIEGALIVTKQRPKIFPGAGGGAIYSADDMDPDSEVAKTFRQIEAENPGHILIYDDNDHAWYGNVRLVQRSFGNLFRELCPISNTTTFE